jgi:hypothetical protein
MSESFRHGNDSGTIRAYSVGIMLFESFPASERFALRKLHAGRSEPRRARYRSENRSRSQPLGERFSPLLHN